MTLKEFINKTRWTPNGGLDSAANYSGPDLSEWCKGPGRSRDSEILDESNFETALERLGGEVDGEVEVHRFGHWACGWFETIMVNPRNLKAITELKKIHEDLERYPVLDDDDYYERENEYQSKYAEQVKSELAEALAMHFGLETEHDTDSKIKTALQELAYQLNIECQRYYGNDSCVDVYIMRDPDESDLKRLKTCIDQLYFHSQNSLEEALADYLSACLGGTEEQ